MNALVIAFFAVVAIVAAAPAGPASPASPAKAVSHEEPIAIVSQKNEMNPDGSYINAYETANGISVSEEGTLEVSDKETVLVMHGKSSYTAPDGTPIDIEWTADASGYHVKGAHLPVTPKTPEYVLKAQAWNEAHPEEEKEELPKKL